MNTNEKVMVYIDFDVPGDRLIQRGYELVQLFQCAPLYVVSVVPGQRHVLDSEKQAQLASWEAHCNGIGAQFMVIAGSTSHPEKTILAAALNCGVTQLVIGQPLLTRWQTVVHGSLAQKLLRKIEHIDLHIVAAERMAACYA